MKAFGVRGSSPGNVKAMHIDTRGNLYVCESRNIIMYVSFSGINY